MVWLSGKAACQQCVYIHVCFCVYVCVCLPMCLVLLKCGFFFSPFNVTAENTPVCMGSCYYQPSSQQFGGVRYNFWGQIYQYCGHLGLAFSAGALIKQMVLHCTKERCSFAQEEQLHCQQKIKEIFIPSHPRPEIVLGTVYRRLREGDSREHHPVTFE